MADAAENLPDDAPGPPAPGPTPPPDLKLVDPVAEAARAIAGAARPSDTPPPPSPEPPPPQPERRRPGRPRKPDSRRSHAAKKANETRRERAAQDPSPATEHGDETKGATDDERLEDAKGFNAIFFLAAITLIGDEMTPTEMEARRCDAALAEYLKRYPGWKPRPEIGLAMVYLVWFNSRMQATPTAKEKVQIFVGRMKEAVKRAAARFRKKAPAP